MRISALIDGYSAAKRISLGSKRRLGYELAIWLRCGGCSDVESITNVEIETWRTSAVAAGLRPRTIESVIATVRLLATHHGQAVDVGHRLRHVPVPATTPAFSDFEKLVAAAPDHLRWWLCVAYVTGLRLGDMERVTPAAETIVTCSKTQKTQRFPVPACVMRLAGGSLNIPRKRLRAELKALCERCGVAVITPQVVRTLSAREWERARPGCGAIILGHALPGWSDATRYYLDPSEQLFLAIDNLRLPRSIMTAGEVAAVESGRAKLLSAFDRLPVEKRNSLVTVAVAMG